jgi:hypothetical protein
VKTPFESLMAASKLIFPETTTDYSHFTHRKPTEKSLAIAL